MRKNSIAIISLAFLASCFMVSCSTEAFDTNQPVKGARIVIPAEKMGTKAVDVAGKATFNTSENVYIAKEGAIDANVLNPSAGGASTTFTGTLAGSYATGDHITVLYNTNASGVVDYSGQDGAIENVKDGGWAADVEIVSLEGDVLTTESAKLENLQSIFKFTFINASTSAEIGGIRFVRIYSNSNKLVATYDVLTPTSDNSTYGPITVSRNSDLADNYIYVALRFDANPSDVIRFEVVDKDNNVYLGTKTAPAAGFENGIFYNSSVTVTLTPASKMAFRGYEVSAGILKRTKSGDADATYSLTSGEMTRISGTVNYALPGGCNPFEPAVYYGNDENKDKYFNLWLTLRGELGASGNNINTGSEQLPSGWYFPSGGGDSTDWGNILFGAPKSTITVNGTTVTSKPYAMTSVALGEGNSYGVAAKTYYGLFLLRDGSTIPSGYFRTIGDSDYTANPVLSETQFNELIQLGCLFISASGYYSTKFNSWRDLSASWHYGCYWSNKHYSSTAFYSFEFSNATDQASAHSRSSSSTNNYYVVKLVKPL